MHSSNKKLAHFLLVILALGFVLLASGYLNRSTDKEEKKQQIAKAGEEFVLAPNKTDGAPFPSPLHSAYSDPDTFLSREGVLLFTNEVREEFKLEPFLFNELLARAAEAKLQDMFSKQYFAHISPDGRRPADSVRETGYEFLIVGENLAMGNFGSDEKVVDSWMNSPGHRANILREGYLEIGIAVGQGVFDGHETWLAVQAFGTPLNVCPLPVSELADEVAAQDKYYSLLGEDFVFEEEDALRFSIYLMMIDEHVEQVKQYSQCLDSYGVER